jgi:hypothetical protein
VCLGTTREFNQTHASMRAFTIEPFRHSKYWLALRGGHVFILPESKLTRLNLFGKLAEAEGQLSAKPCHLLPEESTQTCESVAVTFLDGRVEPQCCRQTRVRRRDVFVASLA